MFSDKAISFIRDSQYFQHFHGSKNLIEGYSDVSHTYWQFLPFNGDFDKRTEAFVKKQNEEEWISCGIVPNIPEILGLINDYDDEYLKDEKERHFSKVSDRKEIKKPSAHPVVSINEKKPSRITQNRYTERHRFNTKNSYFEKRNMI